MTETNTPVGAREDEAGLEFVIGNTHSSASDYDTSFDGKIADPRIYGRITPQSEVTTLYNGGTPDETLLTDGLRFQGFAVRDEDLADFVDQTLTTSQKVFDNVFKVVGSIHGTPVGRAAP